MARAMAMFLAWAVVRARPIARTILTIRLQVLPYDISLSVLTILAYKYLLLHKSILSLSAIFPYVYFSITTSQGHWQSSI